MDIFSFVRTLLPGAKKSAGDSARTWIVQGGNDSGVDERKLLAANKEWVYIAVDRIASSVAAVRLKVMKYRTSGDDQEVFDGPLVEFLEKPSANFTCNDFVYLNTVYKELTGNSFWERLKGNDLTPLIPTGVTPVIDKGVLIGYKYSEGGKQRTIQAKNVLHDRYVDPSRPYWGTGKLAKIARWVDTSSFSNEFLRRFFINGATFGGFIETEEESEDRIKLIKLGLANDHVGVNNAHKIGVLPKGTKYAKTTANMAEMEMGATDDRYRDKILAGFGVPKTLVGLTTEVNRASAEASEYIFARYTIEPIIKDLIAFLNNEIAPIIGGNDKYYFAYEEFVPVNMEIALKEREIALNRQPYMTVNEVRAEKGLPPVKGGDVVYGSPFQTPLGQPMAAPEPGADPVDDEDDEKDEETPQKAIPAHLRHVVTKERALDQMFRGIAAAVKAIPEETGLDFDAIAHKTFVSRVDAHQKLIADKVRLFNNKQRNAVIQKLNQITKAVAKTDLYDMDEQVGALVDAIAPMLRGLLTEQAIEEYKAQNLPGSFDSGSDAIRVLVERAAKRFSKSYNNTTAKLLKKALNEGLSAGEGLVELTKRVATIYDFSDVSRAEAVAHTEAFYIANEGNREAYRQSGVVKTLRWYTAEDELVCEYCGPQNGTIIGVEETFFKKGDAVQGRDGGTLSLDYRAIDVPPLHTYCRCFIRPETIEVGE